VALYSASRTLMTTADNAATATLLPASTSCATVRRADPAKTSQTPDQAAQGVELSATATPISRANGA